MDNVDNKNENNNEKSDKNKEDDELLKIVQIKSHQTFNESNLMTIPWINLKRKKIGKLERKWIRDNEEVGITVSGSAVHGCPTIHELDVLLALFKIQGKNISNQLIMDSDNKVTNMPQKINFTYRELAKTMGLSGFGKETKKRLTSSIECMIETTVYSDFAIKNQESGDYIIDVNGRKSCNILQNYTEYSITKAKKNGEDILNGKEIKEYQSVEIDTFFFENLCNNYFKLFDYNKYKLLTKSISKKLLLILAQWSHGCQKFISFQVLYDYIGIDVKTKKDKYYYNRQIRDACEELIKVKIIQNYNMEHDKGVNFVFNTTALNKSKGLDKYTTDAEIVARLRELGITYDEINKYCRLDTMSYIAALLRYIDYKIENNHEIKDLEKYVRKGLKYNAYNVEDFEING